MFGCLTCFLRFLLHSPGWPGTKYANQVGLKKTCLPLLSSEIKRYVPYNINVELNIYLLNSKLKEHLGELLSDVLIYFTHSGMNSLLIHLLH